MGGRGFLFMKSEVISVAAFLVLLKNQSGATVESTEKNFGHNISFLK